MVPLRLRWVEEDDALKGPDFSTLLSAAKPRVDRTRRAIVAGREDELDATLFLLLLFGQAASRVAAAEAESTILLHALLAVGGVGSGLM